MQELLDKSNINYSKLTRLIHKIISKELSNLVEPCYYPEIKKYYYELLYASGLTEKDVKEYTKRFWAGRPESKWFLHMDAITMFYIWLSWVYINQNNKVVYFSLISLIGLRNYTNLINKQIKTCNLAYFKLTLEHLSKTHLFSREKTISNAILYLSKEMQKKHTKGIKAIDKDQVAKFITEYRHRISQSIKKFAELYYRIAEKGVGIKKPYEDEDGATKYADIKRTSIVVIETIKKITVYKYIDSKAINDARNITKISASLAALLAKTITNTKYSDEIKIVLDTFLKDATKVNLICGKEYIGYVRKLQAVRRSNKPNFKFYVHKLLLLLLKDMKYTKKYESLTKQTQFLVDTYLAYYVTMVMRNIIC